MEKLKRMILVILAFVAVISFVSTLVGAENVPAEKVVVYYFHGTARCYTCNLMEKYSKEAVESNFKDALDSGKLEFKAINVEEKGNEHFVKDYRLYTKTLILSLVKDGKEAQFKNLDKIWECSRDKQKFIDYVTYEINGFLKDSK